MEDVASTPEAPRGVTAQDVSHTTRAASASDADLSDDTAAGSYLDFEVEIAPGEGRSYPVAVIRSPAGESRGVMEFPYDQLALDSKLKDLQVALLRSGGARRQTLTPEEAGVRGFGQAIFDALLSGDARSRYDVSRREARRRGRGLRLKLRIRAPELARLPWEYLYDGRVGEYVCLSRDTPIVRFMETAHPIEPLTVTPPLRILAMVVSPADLPPLDTDREQERLERALAPIRIAGVAELVWLQGKTWRDLQRAMRGGPWHVFHFIGHGGFDTASDQGIVALADEEGRAHRLLATEMGRLLADHRSLRLVLLNSCEGARASREDVFSSTAAVLVRRGIPAVLAMQHEITDRAAIEFSRAFFEALADNLPVDTAVTEARKAVSLAVANTMEWGTPVLYMRAPQGVIFEMPELGRAPHAVSQASSSTVALESAFTEALSAYWVGDWSTACGKLQAIIAEDPHYADAATKYADAKQRLAWESLYAEALSAEENGELDTAMAALAELVTTAPTYLDAEERLESLRKRVRLDELLAEARRLSEAQQWRAVLAVVAEIRELEPDFTDEDGLLSSADEGVRELEQCERHKDLYAQAVRLMDNDEWRRARELLIEVWGVDPDYQDTVRLLARCDRELGETAEKLQREQQAARLYEEITGLAEAEEWLDAISKLDKLSELAPGYADSERIRQQAQTGLEEDPSVQPEGPDAEPATAIEQPDPTFAERRGISTGPSGKRSERELSPRRRFLRKITIAAILVAIPVVVLVLMLGSNGVPKVTERFDQAGYDSNLFAYPEGADVTQQGEALAISVSDANGQAGISLSDYPFDSSESTFLEARVRLDPKAMGGNVLVGLCCEPVDTNCLISSEGVTCWFSSGNRIEWEHDESSDSTTSWQDLKLEFDADERRFTYFINDEQVGSMTPAAEAFGQTKSYYTVRVHNESGPKTVGYVDSVHIGRLEK